MSGELVVYKNRTNTITVSLGINVAGDVITSEIRAEPDVASPLLMTWTVAYATDGTDGELILSVDDNATAQIKANSGYMDIKRVTGGEPVPVFDRPVEVEFRGAVTE
jgi:hypothetical protein